MFRLERRSEDLTHALVDIDEGVDGSRGLRAMNADPLPDDLVPAGCSPTVSPTVRDGWRTFPHRPQTRRPTFSRLAPGDAKAPR